MQNDIVDGYALTLTRLLMQARPFEGRAAEAATCWNTGMARWQADAPSR